MQPWVPKPATLQVPLRLRLTSLLSDPKVDLSDQPNMYSDDACAPAVFIIVCRPAFGNDCAVCLVGPGRGHSRDR